MNSKPAYIAAKCRPPDSCLSRQSLTSAGTWIKLPSPQSSPSGRGGPSVFNSRDEEIKRRRALFLHFRFAGLVLDRDAQFLCIFVAIARDVSDRPGIVGRIVFGFR